jgi:hypothetical protein
MIMLDLLKEFGMFHYLKFKDEYIRFGEESVVLYFLPHLAKEYVHLSQVFGLDYGIAEFLASKFMGGDFVQTHGIPLKKTLVNVVDISCKVLNAFGWGKFKTIKVDEDKNFMLLEAESSTFAQEVKNRYGPQKYPVDWMLAGLFAGAQEYYTKRKTYAVELNCMAQKNTKKCVFLCTSEENIVKYTKKFSPEKVMWTIDMVKRAKKIEKKVV